MTTEKEQKLLKQMIEELNQWDALEFHFTKEKGLTHCYLPYMMNDALEYYVIFRNCRTTGEVSCEFQEATTAGLIREHGRRGLVVREGNSHVFTIWFEDFEIVRRCCQYHRIGHFWVQGQEQWRQLVYMIGTMYDKQEYVGNEVCNDQERALLPLMEFPPFRMWFPLNEIPSEKYPDTREGWLCMKELAKNAGDRRYALLVSLYGRFPIPWLSRRLGYALLNPSRQALYRHIWEKVTKASLEYPVRNYGKKQNNQIERMRREASAALHRNGFQGNYPCFRKGNLQIFAAEEHPFTVMESEDFHFRIQYMVSRSQKHSDGINCGFFRGRQNESHIERDLTFL